MYIMILFPLPVECVWPHKITDLFIFLCHLFVFHCFPFLIGPKNNHEEAAEFIKAMFLSVNDNPGKLIFPHYTTATDTENIKRVFEGVKRKVLEDNLRDYNLIA